MSLLKRIKTEQVQARIALRNNPKMAKDITGEHKVAFLSTLLSEAQRPGFDDGKRESTDAEVVAVVKKFIKNANETLNANPDHWEAKREVEYLEAYLPTQLDKHSLTAIIEELIEDGANNMGLVMKRLKAERDGQYDGKMASQIARELLK